MDKFGIVRKIINVKNREPRLPAIAPMNMRKAIIIEAHASPWSGHGAIFRTTERILDHFWWPTMFSEIRNAVNSCPVCQLAKTPVNKKAPLQSLPIPAGPNQRVHMDLMGELRSDDEFKYILVVTDAYTKYAIVTPITDKSAATVAKAFFESWIAQFSCPKLIVSDQGKEFVNKTMEEMNKRLKIGHNRTSSYHPESNSSAESFNRSIIKFMQCALENETLKWSEWVKTLQISYNTTVHRTTKCTPFALTHAFLPTLPFFDLQRPRVYYGDNLGAETATRLNKSFMWAKKNSEEAIAEQERYYNLKTKTCNYKIGDQVMVRNKGYITSRIENTKMQYNWDGPYKIISQTAELNFIIKNSKRTREIHVNRIRHFKYSDFFDKNNDTFYRTNVRQPTLRKGDYSEENQDDESIENNKLTNSKLDKEFPPLRRSTRLNPPEVSEEEEESQPSRTRNDESENERNTNDILTPLPDINQSIRRRSLLIKRELVTPPQQQQQQASIPIPMSMSNTTSTVPPALAASGSPVNVTAGRNLSQVQPRNVTATPLPAESGSPVAPTVSAPFKAKASSKRTVDPNAIKSSYAKPILKVKTVIDKDFVHSGAVIKDIYKAKNAAVTARANMKRTVSVGDTSIRQKREIIKAASPTKPKIYIGEDRLVSMQKLNLMRKEDRERKRRRAESTATTPIRTMRRPSMTSPSSSGGSAYSTPMSSELVTAKTGAIPKQRSKQIEVKNAGGDGNCNLDSSTSSNKSNYSSNFSRLKSFISKRSDEPNVNDDTPKTTRIVPTRPLRSNYEAPKPTYIKSTVEKEVKKLRNIQSSIKPPTSNQKK